MEPVVPVSHLQAPQSDAALRQTAEDLEATFLAEMLKAARFGEARDTFGGGVGEEQFASFLRDDVAQSMAAGGGIGLSEHIFRALQERQNGG
ncbi:MAG: rod-binding protein [Pseudomonadota bacterium]